MIDQRRRCAYVLVIWITVGAFAVFGVIYGVIYKLTAGAYYRIVSSADNV